MFNAIKLHEKLQEIESLITSGPIDELIDYAKDYDIHQTNGTSRYYEQVNKIKNRLVAEGIDPETIRK
jgi:hypothetical protein